MVSNKSKTFSEISYFALNQMENQSDDERAPEIKEDVVATGTGGSSDDEFSTYFTDQKVEIPDDDRVRKNLLLSGKRRSMIYQSQQQSISLCNRVDDSTFTTM